MPDGTDLALEIKEALEIDETNILEELRRHSAKYFYYGVLWARASRQKRKLSLKLKELEARLVDVLRRQVAAEDSKSRVTEAIKTEYLHGHPDFLEALAELTQAEYMLEVLEVAKDGMRMRGMALQELARQLRTEEMYGDEFRAMKKEYDERVKEAPKRERKKRVKKDLDPVIDPESAAQGDV